MDEKGAEADRLLPEPPEESGDDEDTAPSPPAFADRGTSLEALNDALTRASSVSGSLWLSYLFVLFYLLIAASGVGHEDLLFETPVKLPFLGVDLPLSGFFWLGPALFLIVHAYVLLHFVMLADKIAAFDGEFRRQIADPATAVRLRGQLPSNVFVQLLAGPHDLRHGVVGLLLWLIALISLVIGPIALLVFFELQFLAYHNEPITWWQRIATVLEVALLWVLWPKIAFGAEPPAVSWRMRLARLPTFAIMGVSSILALGLVLFVATFPGEAWQDALRGIQPQWLEKLLIAGDTDRIARRPKSLWSNVLVLPDFDASAPEKSNSEEKEKPKALPAALSLRGRHLEGAVLEGAALRNADLTGAFMAGARLVSADLETVDLDEADLRGAVLDRAQLQGASLATARLDGASLYRTDLEGVSLVSAQLRGASLDSADMTGADLDFAVLDAASLDHTILRGALLDGTHFVGAIIDYAHFEVAMLHQPDFRDARVFGAYLWGAEAPTVLTQGALFAKLGFYADSQCDRPDGSCWSDAVFDKVKQAIERSVHDPLRRMQELFAVERARDPNQIVDPTGALMAAIENPGHPAPEPSKIALWQQLQAASPTEAGFADGFAVTWREIGCQAGESAHYVVAGMARRMDGHVGLGSGDEFLGTDDPLVPRLAAAFLDPSCLGARGIDPDTRERLKRLAARTVKPAGAESAAP